MDQSRVLFYGTGALQHTCHVAHSHIAGSIRLFSNGQTDMFSLSVPYEHDVVWRHAGRDAAARSGTSTETRQESLKLEERDFHILTSHGLVRSSGWQYMRTNATR